jgi:hypothetical protein
VNLSDFYSYRFIGKMTVSLQLQEFSLHNMIVTSSTSAARLSLHSSPSNPVYARSVDSSALFFSLSSHRHSYIVYVCIAHVRKSTTHRDGNVLGKWSIILSLKLVSMTHS